MSNCYSTITETPGIGASKEQLSMLYTRYRFAASFCKGKDVLEVACGAGQGLGYLARLARRVVGGDIDEENINHARNQYGNRSNIEIQKIDAHKISHTSSSFDLIILFEAIYYLKDPDIFLEECRRLLRPGGQLVLCSVNREWSDFNPSPFSVRYFSAFELKELLERHGFDGEALGAFPVRQKGWKDLIVSLIKRTAVSLHLIPRTMKGKQLLKRIFFGHLTPLPREVTDGVADYVSPVPLTNGSANRYKVLFAVGHKRG